MKRVIISFMALCFCALLAAQTRTVKNPAYEFTSNSIKRITKIELTPKETRLYLHFDYLPGAWVKFFDDAYLLDPATGKKYKILRLENHDFGGEIKMSESGEADVVAVYEPLDKSVKTLQDDFGPGTGSIYGISLNPKEHYKPKNTVPADIQAWIDAELAKAKRKTLMDFDKGEFFAMDTSHIVGYIKGYDKRAGFNNGIIYASNEITREDFPVTATIQDDGRFEVAIPMNYPQCQYFLLGDGRFRTRIEYYLEPGQTLAMILEWDDFLISEIHQGNYKFRKTQYQGPVADIIREMDAFKSQLPEVAWGRVYGEGMKKTPDEIKPFIYDTLFGEYNKKFKSLLTSEQLQPRTRLLLENRFKMWPMSYLWEYEMSYKNNHKGETLPISFYDFLHTISMNDKTLLADENFSTFINRFEFFNLFRECIRAMYMPKKTFGDYLFTELALKKTPEDEHYFALVDSLNSGKYREQRDSMVARYERMYDSVQRRYAKESADYNAKYLPKIDPKDYSRIKWYFQDSIYTQVLKLKPGVIYEIVKSRDLCSSMSIIQKKDAASQTNALSSLVDIAGSFNEPFLRSEAERIFIKTFPVGGKKGYKLPDTPAANFFKELIAPYKGKYILVDFWAIWCGPCVGNIKRQKELRASYKDSKDFVFLFITDGSSPEDKYKEFVAENELTHTNRISDAQYLYMRELFRFNGIPRYVLVGRDGRILDDNAQGHNAETIFKQLLEEEKDDE